MEARVTGSGYRNFCVRSSDPRPQRPGEPVNSYVRIRFNGLKRRAWKGDLYEFGCRVAPVGPDAWLIVYFRLRDDSRVRFCDLVRASDQLLCEIHQISGLVLAPSTDITH